jgi:LuxR family transcriptional regulator of spore coat protein
MPHPFADAQIIVVKGGFAMVTDVADHVVLLTQREQEILEYVADGWSAKQVARLTQLAPRTVERHIENIRIKMHSRNAPHMVSYAYSNGILRIAAPAMPGQ